MWTTMLWIGLGVVLLIVGGEWLVRGASRLGRAARISPPVGGMVQFSSGPIATSAPEFAVSVRAALSGEVTLAIGNVTGSNIANVGLILGLSALAAPLHVPHQLARFDVRVMLGLFVLMWVLGADGGFSRFDGLVLLAVLALYLTMLVVAARRLEHLVGEPAPITPPTRR
ncbi:MAG TPA: hypothetical protein PK954_01165, partial [Anaerolineales bacterium]|nr:hypothetical protein [Anaerolineales bacterium]